MHNTWENVRKLNNKYLRTILDANDKHEGKPLVRQKK
jgi:hypothetical protein